MHWKNPVSDEISAGSAGAFPMTRQSIPHYIHPQGPLFFPDVEQAMIDPEGLLAVGGDLSPERLIHAYQQGIFPWFSDDQPILWWSPNPRLVLFPEHLHVSRTMQKAMRNSTLEIRVDTAFLRVMHACSEPRPNQPGTWITDDMIDAYCQLHQQGIAHSIEAWDGPNLVGGLYGVAIGKVFFGESMFSRQDNASKIAFITFVQHFQRWGGKLIDCQVTTQHLSSLGAEEISRTEFSTLLHNWCQGNKTVWPEQKVCLT